MFTKKKHLGSAHAFRTVIDWEAIGGAIGIGLVLLFFIGVALN